MDVTMPQLGETVTEGTITRWLKQVGEHVDADEPLFEVSTDKVDSEVPAPSGGVITEILVPEGETVEVGTRLAVVSDSAAAAPAPAAAPVEAPAPAPVAAPAPEPPAPAPVAAPASFLLPLRRRSRWSPRCPRWSRRHPNRYRNPRRYPNRNRVLGPSRWRPSMRATDRSSRHRSCAAWWPSEDSTRPPSRVRARRAPDPQGRARRGSRAAGGPVRAGAACPHPRGSCTRGSCRPRARDASAPRRSQLSLPGYPQQPATRWCRSTTSAAGPPSTWCGRRRRARTCTRRSRSTSSASNACGLRTRPSGRRPKASRSPICRSSPARSATR